MTVVNSKPSLAGPYTSATNRAAAILFCLNFTIFSFRNAVSVFEHDKVPSLWVAFLPASGAFKHLALALAFVSPAVMSALAWLATWLQPIFGLVMFVELRNRLTFLAVIALLFPICRPHGKVPKPMKL